MTGCHDNSDATVCRSQVANEEQRLKPVRVCVCVCVCARAGMLLSGPAIRRDENDNIADWQGPVLIHSLLYRATTTAVGQAGSHLPATWDSPLDLT